MKFKLPIVLCLLLANFSQSQTFYEPETIQEIRLTFSQPDWQLLLNNEQLTTQNYIPAESVSINGAVFNNVGVKYKGNSSFIPFAAKNPFHIELDTYQSQDYQGFTDIKLSNVIFDPTFIRETLSYALLGQYMAAPKANYANVYVNDMLIGLYVNVEAVSKKFVKKHFYSDNNAFFDCSPVNGANNVTEFTELPTLIYWGPDESNYNLAYRMKSETGMSELIDMIQKLNTDVPAIESVLDVDRVLWMLAFDNIMVNIDSYIGTFAQNYYLYKDDNGRFNPVVWDLNMSFGSFADLGSSFLEDTTQKMQLSPLQHSTDVTFPLVSRLFNVPRYRKMYFAHYNTILQENFVNNSYLIKAQALQSIIDSAVQADPNNLNSYFNFQHNMNNDVLTNNNLVAPGITTLVTGRTTFLSALPNFTNPKPVITNVLPSSPNPTVGSAISITANILNTNSNAVFLGHRFDFKGVFTKIPMFDDGNHNDGIAGDNVYGAQLTISNTYMQYYIYAENNTIGAFSPERAEYEFHVLDAVYPMVVAGELAINEIMAQNTTGQTDPAGNFEDWVELYNTTSNTISLDNVHMTDDPNNLQKWQFPVGLTIAPNSYLVVWADEDLDEEGLHADFKLSAGGESVILSYPNGTIVDSVTFGQQTANISYARIPNGTGPFVTQSPTFNANNESLSTDDFVTQFIVKMYPNPATDLLNISAPAEITDVSVYNMLGQRIVSEKFNSQTVQVATDVLAKGVYLVSVKTSEGSASQRIIKQ